METTGKGGLHTKTDREPQRQTGSHFNKTQNDKQRQSTSFSWLWGGCNQVPEDWLESGHYYFAAPVTSLFHLHFQTNPVCQIKLYKKSLQNEYLEMIHVCMFSVNVESLYFFYFFFEKIRLRWLFLAESSSSCLLGLLSYKALHTQTSSRRRWGPLAICTLEKKKIQTCNKELENYVIILNFVVNKL